jgi:ABC-type arginine transport system ATPase subunit
MTRVDGAQGEGISLDNHELENVFEQRAEFLTSEELERWTRLTAREEGIVRKLMGAGAKLLVGPRGCGKSTLMRLAYFRLIRSGESIPVYVNYARSLALEPFFHSRSDAIKVFRQWVIAKVVVGVSEALTELGRDLSSDWAQAFEDASRFIKALEAGVEAPSLPVEWGAPSTLLERLEGLCNYISVPRAVLLLDDAAHAFSAEQQREFFEIFRELRSKFVAPKAAVYPGITSYSPNFHVGHEAEVIEAWLGVDDPAYLSSMRTLVDRRLPESLRSRLSDKEDIVDYLALAAFGLPRGFINMLSEVVGLEDESSSSRPRAVAPKVVEGHVESVIKVYSGLASKVPKLRNYVEAGDKAWRRLIEWLVRYNTTHGGARKATVVGIAEPIPQNLLRILHMMEYAGLVRDAGTASRGHMSFRRYQIHFGLIVSQNALVLGRNPSIKTVNDELLARDSQAIVRLRSASILTNEELAACTLSLLPCGNCGTPRAFPEQRFCMNCGAELRDGSVYLDLLRTPIDDLPLPRAKIDGISGHTSLKTVHDILMDDEAQELRRVPRIGPVWSKRIRTVAEEFVSV